MKWNKIWERIQRGNIHKWVSDCGFQIFPFWVMWLFSWTLSSAPLSPLFTWKNRNHLLTPSWKFFNYEIKFSIIWMQSCHYLKSRKKWWRLHVYWCRGDICTHWSNCCSISQWPDNASCWSQINQHPIFNYKRKYIRELEL